MRQINPHILIRISISIIVIIIVVGVTLGIARTLVIPDDHQNRSDMVSKPTHTFVIAALVPIDSGDLDEPAHQPIAKSTQYTQHSYIFLRLLSWIVPTALIKFAIDYYSFMLRAHAPSHINDLY